MSTDDFLEPIGTVTRIKIPVEDLFTRIRSGKVKMWQIEKILPALIETAEHLEDYEMAGLLHKQLK